jgi:hypothetical protein
VRPLQPLQRAALWVALGLGVLIVIIAAPLTIGWLVYAPQPPRLEGLTQEQVVAAVATYRELVQIHESARECRASPFRHDHPESAAAHSDVDARVRLRQSAAPGLIRAMDENL